MDGYVVRVVSFESPVGGRVPAYLHRPSGPLAAGASPALLMQHGMPGDPASLEGLAAAYARAGVFVLSISAPFNRPDSLSDRAPGLLPAPHFDMHDSTHVVQLVHEQRRALDMLQALPEVDPERVGFVGFSYGGWIGALLASVEPRLAAAVLMAPTGGLASLLRSHWDNTGYLFVLAGRALEEEQRARWLRMMEPLEAERWLGRDRRTPVLIQAGLYDRTVLPPEAHRLFIGAAHPKKLLWYAAGHDLGRTAFHEQAAFLADAMGIDLDRFKAPASLF
ncbi:MAG: prolyl oligopeptidase family serine peptidase [Gemmatimonadota bacterium]